MRDIDAHIAELIDRERRPVDRLREAALVERTVSGYKWAWEMFASWCSERGLEPTAPGVLAVWMHTCWEKRPSTLQRYANAASWHCRQAGLPDPSRDVLVQRLLGAHARFHDIAPLDCNTVQPFDKAQLIAVITAPIIVRGPSELSDARGRAAILLAWHRVPMSQIIRPNTGRARASGRRAGELGQVRAAACFDTLRW